MPGTVDDWKKKLWQSLGSARDRNSNRDPKKRPAYGCPDSQSRTSRLFRTCSDEPASQLPKVWIVRHIESLPCHPLPVKLMQRFGMGGILAVKNVLNRTYKATPTVHSHRLPGSESSYLRLGGLHRALYDRWRYREYHRQHHRAQRHYWNWRHSHPDRD